MDLTTNILSLMSLPYSKNITYLWKTNKNKKLYNNEKHITLFTLVTDGLLLEL